MIPTPTPQNQANQSNEAPVPVTITASTHSSLGLAYLQAGDKGLPLVMLHGWGAFKELWWNTLSNLGRDYRCYALDLPGHGGSAFGRAASIVALCERVVSFCDSMGLREIVLLGHSMGGSVAAELALRRPDLLRQLILVDAAINAYQMPIYARVYATVELGWPMLRLSQALARFFSPIGRRVPHEHGGGWLRPWLRRSSYLAGYEPEGLHRQLRSLFATRADERLAQISTPTLVISGQLDGLVPPANSRRLAATIPGAQYVEIMGALHNPMDERPRAFARVVREFLESGKAVNEK